VNALWKIVLSKDVLAGVLFSLIGAALLMEAGRYTTGTLLRMGPGFFPSGIGIGLLLLGAGIVVKAILERTEERPSFAVMPAALVTAAPIAFAFLLPRFGLVAATFLLIVISRLAFRPFRPIETLVLATILAAVAAFIFGYLLRLPLRIWP
jgi:hypothetical protein